jgi:dihydropteroate synthase type 2
VSAAQNRKVRKSSDARLMAQIFGILNITADSFSDGGDFLSPDKALAQAQKLLADGAHVLDVGPASSHPDAGDVPPHIEIERLQSIWAALKKLGAPLSVDSFQPETQRWAMAQGADWLNDVNGFADPSLYDELADYDGRLVLMHAIQAKGIATRQDAPQGDIWAHIFKFFEARLKALDKAGVAQDKITLDPGMGFFLGNQPETSLAVLAGLARLKAEFGLPVLVCVSRKSFLRALAGVSIEESGPISLAAEVMALAQGVDFIRTHDAKPLAQAIHLRSTMGTYL